MLWSGSPGAGGKFLAGQVVTVSATSARFTLLPHRRYLITTDTSLVWRQGGALVDAVKGAAGCGYLGAAGGLIIETSDDADRYFAVVQQSAGGFCYAQEKS